MHLLLSFGNTCKCLNPPSTEVTNCTTCFNLQKLRIFPADTIHVLCMIIRIVNDISWFVFVMETQ
jgi:hypothetical protein